MTSFGVTAIVDCFWYLSGLFRLCAYIDASSKVKTEGLEVFLTELTPLSEVFVSMFFDVLGFVFLVARVGLAC